MFACGGCLGYKFRMSEIREIISRPRSETNIKIFHEFGVCISVIEQKYDGK